MKKPLLLVFCKNPEIGKVKTRLAASIGPEKALAVYQLLLKKTAATLSELEIDIHLYYTGDPIKNDVFELPKVTKKKQTVGNLGERMYHAFTDGFTTHSPVLIIGTDLWSLEALDIQNAINALAKKEVVIGPSKDGGYYLLGLNRMIPSLFRNKKWGANSVLSDTCQDIAETQLQLLVEKNDIDTLEDLKEHATLYQLIHE